MSVSDPVADMLTRIRNGLIVRQESVLIPASNLKIGIIKILKEEGFIKDFEVVLSGVHKVLKVNLSYKAQKEPAIRGLKLVSKPSLRKYISHRDVPRIQGGLGVVILSTPQGIMTGKAARKRAIGGEFICYVW